MQGIGSTVVYGRDRERRKSRHFTQEQQAERYPIKEQVARIGNSVVPIMAKVLVQANCPHLIREELSA